MIVVIILAHSCPNYRISYINTNVILHAPAIVGLLNETVAVSVAASPWITIPSAFAPAIYTDPDPFKSSTAAISDAIGKEILNEVSVAVAVGVRANPPATCTTFPTLVHWAFAGNEVVVFTAAETVGVYVPLARYCFVVPVTVPTLCRLLP
jgi:hypothetical protein